MSTGRLAREGRGDGLLLVSGDECGWMGEEADDDIENKLSDKRWRMGGFVCARGRR